MPSKGRTFWIGVVGLLLASGCTTPNQTNPPESSTSSSAPTSSESASPPVSSTETSVTNNTTSTSSNSTSSTNTTGTSGPLTVAFSTNATSALESASSVNLRVNLSEPANVTVTVKFAVTGGTATGNGTDYALTNGTLSFEPNETIKFLSLSLVDDALDEANETALLGLSNATNATLGSLANMTLTILDDDPAPTVAFASASSGGSEANTSVNLTVTLTTASGQNVTVTYNVTGGTATGGGTDYTLANGSLTFTPGQTSRVIGITVVNDILVESDETIVVELTAPTNALLGSPSTHTYTIQNNDP